VVGGFAELEVGDAVAEELLLGEFLEEDDLGGLAGCIGNGDFDEGAVVVTFAAFEAQGAARHVLAGDDVVATLGMADAGEAADFDARVLAAIDLGRIRLERRRQGEDRRAPLPGRVNRGLGRSGGLRQKVLLLRRRSGGRGGAADGVAVNDELDAAVALAAFGGVVRSDGLRFAEAAGGDG
jgi:hypothetical protein